MDAWLCAPFESGPAAVDDLVLRVAKALARRGARVELPVAPVPVADPPDQWPWN